MPPEVTVIVPTHNRCDRIGPTLAGALGQEDVELEVVVVDDCSSDGTAECLGEIDEPRLRVLRNSTNLRQATTRNRGIAEARSEWVALLDDDDLWSPRKLREQLDAAALCGADISFSTAVLLDEALEATGVFRPTPPEEEPRDILRRYSVPAGCSNVIVRTELLRDLGGFDERLDPGSDWDLFIRLFLSGSIAVLPESHVGYVLHPIAMSADNLRRQFSDFDLIERKHREARREYGVEMDGVQFSRWLAAGLRRGGRRADAARAYLQGARRYRNLGNVVRAVGVAFGEQAMKLGHRPPVLPAEPEPAWLDLYRPGGRFALSLDELASSSARPSG